MRRALRARRRAIPPDLRAAAAAAAAAALATSAAFRTATRIAAYVAVGAELDPDPFIALARTRGREIYLPVLAPAGRAGLEFVRADAGLPLYPNRHGIPEPAAGPRVAPWFLDLALVPLVGFDDRGNRLGMGAGYYDRAFAYRGRRLQWRRPHLIGLAYECQQVDKIEPRSWDVPLDGVVTEHGLRWFARSSH